jgi:hypothetical protein
MKDRIRLAKDDAKLNGLLDNLGPGGSLEGERSFRILATDRGQLIEIADKDDLETAHGLEGPFAH